MSKDGEKPSNDADLAAEEAQLEDADFPIASEEPTAGGSAAGGAASTQGQPGAPAEPGKGAEVGAPPAGTVEGGAAAPVKVRFGDREYTAEELIREPDVLAKMATQSSQVAHYQKIADERAARITELEKAKAPPEQPPAEGAPAPPPLTIEQERSFVAADLKAIQEGARGPQCAELANELPEVYADYLVDRKRTAYFAQAFWKELQDLKKSIHGIVGEASRLTEEAENEAFRGRYTNMLDELAKDRLFEGLGKPEQRQAFTEFFAHEFGHLDDKDVTVKVIRRAYLGWLDEIAPQVFQALHERAEVGAGARQRAGGEVGGGKPPAPAPDDELSRTERELEEAT